jgi:hypothetical protein
MERVSVPWVSSTDGEVANAQVCKTCIRGFNSRSVLHIDEEGLRREA